jgi:hypothetical protein
MVWNKRGSSGGGASTGRHGVKRGGKGGSADSKDNPDVENDYNKRGGGRSADLDPVETADCTTCNGTGGVISDKVETDEVSGFSGTQRVDCSACGGTGRITKRNR